MKVAASEFRARFDTYLDKVVEGEELIVHSRQHGYFKLVPCTKEGDDLPGM